MTGFSRLAWLALSGACRRIAARRFAAADWWLDAADRLEKRARAAR